MESVPTAALSYRFAHSRKLIIAVCAIRDPLPISLCYLKAEERMPSLSRRPTRWLRCLTRPRRRRRTTCDKSTWLTTRSTIPAHNGGWLSRPACMTRYTYLYPGYIDLDKRGAMYNFAWGSGERVGKSTYYINLTADAKGQPLDGSRNYRLKVPANAPVTQFWSATTQSDENGGVLEVPGGHAPR